MGLNISGGSPYNDLTASFLDGPNAWEAQRSNNGFLYVTLPYSINYAGAAGSGNIALYKVLQFAVDSFPIPASANGQISHHFLNEERKYAGKPTFQNMQVTINDYLDADTVGVLSAWRAAVYNPVNGKIGWKRSYAASGHVDMFGPNGQQVRQHVLIGVWPQDFAPAGQVQMQGDASIMCQLTLSIDKVFYNQNVIVAGDYTSGVGLGQNPGQPTSGGLDDGFNNF